MQSIISERAKIREYDASELKDKFELMIKVIMHKMQFTKEATIHVISNTDTVQYMNQQYLQLTGNPLF